MSVFKFQRFHSHIKSILIKSILLLNYYKRALCWVISNIALRRLLIFYYSLYGRSHLKIVVALYALNYLKERFLRRELNSISWKQFRTRESLLSMFHAELHIFLNQKIMKSQESSPPMSMEQSVLTALTRLKNNKSKTRNKAFNKKIKANKNLQTKSYLDGIK